MADASETAVAAGVYVERGLALCYDLCGWSASGAAMAPVPSARPRVATMDHFQWVL